MTWKNNIIAGKPIEQIQEFKPKNTKTHEKLVLKESKAKNIITLIDVMIKRISKDHYSMTEKIYSPNDLILLLRTLREKDIEFNSISIQGWHGKSSFTMEEKGEMIYVTKYQKPEKGAEPKEVKYEIEKSELTKLMLTIKSLIKPNEVIESRDLGEAFYGEDWDNKIFSKRKRHNHFTIMLNVLDKQGKIIYKGGKTKLI